MSKLSTEAKFKLANARTIADMVIEHLRKQGAQIESDGNSSRLRIDPLRGAKLGHGTSGEAWFLVCNDIVSIRIEADDLENISLIKANLAARFNDYAPNVEPNIIWTGDGSNLLHPPHFREMTVVRTDRITPHMRRITFTGDRISHFFVEDDYHFNLLIPQKNKKPEWPTMHSNGLVKWSQGSGKTINRKYTIRQFDREANTIDVDFVLHDDAGPGSDWAKDAKPGDIIGFFGPGGGSFEQADWYLMAGDETALPAVSRILEALPAEAKGVAFVEVADASEEQLIEYDAQVELHWLHRGGAAPGTTTLLQEAIRATVWPNDGSIVYVWAAGEFETFRSIRSYLRKERKLPREQHYVLSYWRRGDDGINQLGGVFELEKADNASET